MAIKDDRCPWCGSAITHAKFVQIQEAIREDERKKLIAAVEQVKKQFEKQQKEEAVKLRQILQKDRDAAMAKKEAAFAREREALQKKIAEMGRRVKKAGGEIPEGIELDLFEELRGAFGEDAIARIKGKPNAILEDVRYKGKSVGRILIDSTPRAAWQHAFVTRVRQDQSELGAEHAILATSAFPANRRELFVDSGVIVIAPARVPAIVEILRKALIAMHVAKLSDAERADKVVRLFRFITSPSFRKRLAEASELAGEALQIDVDEKRTHDLVWKKRGTVLTRIRNVLRDIDADVSAIVEARDEPGPARSNVAAFRVTTK